MSHSPADWHVLLLDDVLLLLPCIPRLSFDFGFELGELALSHHFGVPLVGEQKRELRQSLVAHRPQHLADGGIGVALVLKGEIFFCVL